MFHYTLLITERVCFVASCHCEHFILAFCFNSELCTHCVTRNIWILVFHSSNVGGGKCFNLHKTSRVFNHPHRNKSFRMILLSFFLLYIQPDSRCCEQSRIFFRYSWCLDQRSPETVTCETLEQTNQPSVFIFVLMVACWYFLKAWCLLAYRRSTKLFCFLSLFHCNQMMHFLTEEATYLRRFLGMTDADAVVFLELQTDDQQVSKGLTSDFSRWLCLCWKIKIKTLPKDSDKQPDCWAGTHKLHHVTFHWGHKWQQSNLKQLKLHVAT